MDNNTMWISNRGDRPASGNGLVGGAIGMALGGLAQHLFGGGPHGNDSDDDVGPGAYERREQRRHQEQVRASEAIDRAARI